jgi:dihydroorotate dehydrogenase
MYKIFVKPLLFLITPEKAHYLVFDNLRTAFKIKFIEKIARQFFTVKNKKLERNVLGLHFPNPVGLAAGLDKDAKLFDELSALGFGHIEIGTLTPKAQPGNDQPRLFRLPQDEALINRMGFNNGGVDEAVLRLREKHTNIIIGGNIGKNKVTPNEEAINDYEYCFEKLHSVVDYFVVNVSSPNTPGLRELQDKGPLLKILNRLKELNSQKEKPKPILLKIAPDLTNEQLDDIVEIVNESKIDGVIATNTTISRENLKTDSKEISEMGAGGLSGVPVKKRSTEVIRYLSQSSNNKWIIIGVGGIHSAKDAIEKLNAGAALVQIYTGFVYEGPELVKKINEEILRNS